MNKLLGLVLCVPFVIGCGTDGTSAPGIETLPDLTVPPAPAAGTGWQIITPIFEGIQPAKDYEVCTWTDIIADKETDVRSSQAFQNEPPGHHAILFYTTVKQPPGTQRVCDDSDMATFRFLTGNASAGAINEAPGDLVFRIPAGAQIVVNHHYLNATDSVLRGQVAININFADPTKTFTPVGYIAITNTALDVAQGDTSQDMHAVLTRNFKIWKAIPHMHAWGKHTWIKTTHAGVTSTQFDLDWTDEFTFHPPENKWDPARPMELVAGDAIDVHCEWDNTAGKNLTFGFEMCVGFFSTVDDSHQGSLANDNGNWTPF